MKGNYVSAVFGFVMLILPVYIIIGISTVCTSILMQIFKDEITLGVMSIILITPIVIVLSVLFSPLLNGYIRMFYLCGLTREMNMSEMFYYFQKGRYMKSLLLNLSLLVRLMLPALICWIPVFVYYFICITFMKSFTGTVLFIDFAFILTVLSVILLVLYSLKYFLVFALFIENEQADAHELIQSSRKLMKLHAPQASKLIFSFTPWLLLCLTILPILYVAPYMTQSLCISAKWMLRAE